MKTNNDNISLSPFPDVNTSNIDINKIQHQKTEPSINQIIQSKINDLIQSVKKQDEQGLNILNFYPRRPNSVWFGTNEKKALRQFEHRLRAYNYRRGNMFHLTLKVDHGKFSPLDAEKAISTNFNRFTDNVQRRTKNISIKKYQAIKEWDRTSHPHLHLFIEMIGYKGGVRRLHNLISKHWKMGKLVVKRINDEHYFDEILVYCTRTENAEKRKQMRLPQDFLEMKRIKRIHYSRLVDWDKEKVPFKAYAKAHRWYSEWASEQMINRERRKRVSKPKTVKTRKKYNAKTYREMLRNSQTAVEIKSDLLRPGLWKTLNFGMNFLKKLPVDYNRKIKAYELLLSDDNLRNLMEIEKLLSSTKPA